MSATNWIMRAIAGAAMTAVWALAAGCNPSVGAFCNKVCDCTGCDDAQAAGCVDRAEEARKQARDTGCGDEFNAMLSCMNATFTCENDAPSTVGCEEELESLNACAPGIGGSLGLNPCEAYNQAVIAKYKSCGVTVDSGGLPTTDCPPELAKQSDCLRVCIEPVDCKCVDPDLVDQCTEDLFLPFEECFSSCF